MEPLWPGSRLASRPLGLHRWVGGRRRVCPERTRRGLEQPAGSRGDSSVFLPGIAAPCARPFTMPGIRSLEVLSDEWPRSDALESPKKRPAGTALYHEGDPAGAVYLVRAGFAKLVRTSTSGHRVVVGIRPPGWLLGSGSVVLRRAHLVTA